MGGKLQTKWKKYSQPGRGGRRRLESLGEFFGECAGGALRSVLVTWAFVLPATTLPPWTGWSSIHRARGADSRTL